MASLNPLIDVNVNERSAPDDARARHTAVRTVTTILACVSVVLGLSIYAEGLAIAPHVEKIVQSTGARCMALAMGRVLATASGDIQFPIECDR